MANKDKTTDEIQMISISELNGMFQKRAMTEVMLKPITLMVRTELTHTRLLRKLLISVMCVFLIMWKMKTALKPLY